MIVDLETWFLEMRSPDAFRPKWVDDDRLRFERARVACPELSRFLYTAVGGDWRWIDRLGWDYARWLAWLDRPEVETWVGLCEGNAYGYAELERQEPADVEIVYFGLLPQFTGRGLGAHLLSATVERAWAMAPSRVWVHTCNLDGPAALANYEARGFAHYRTETTRRDFPDTAPGPWPGARG